MLLDQSTDISMAALEARKRAASHLLDDAAASRGRALRPFEAEALCLQEGLSDAYLALRQDAEERAPRPHYRHSVTAAGTVVAVPIS